MRRLIETETRDLKTIADSKGVVECSWDCGNNGASCEGEDFYCRLSWASSHCCAKPEPPCPLHNKPAGTARIVIEVYEEMEDETDGAQD